MFTPEDEARIRRDRVAELYLLGWHQSKIATELGVAPQLIKLDLKAIHAKWCESLSTDFNEAKAKELAKIDHLELTYWQAWQDSKKPIKKSRKKYEGKVDPERPSDRQQVSGFETVDSTQEQQGNPHFLAGIMRCIEKRVAILGLDAPQKIQVDEKNLPSWLRAAKPSLN